MLWIIPGEYNIPEGGYATLSPFFVLSPVLLLALIPALSMRAFSEEKGLKTLELLMTRPIGLMKIIFSKIGAVLMFLLVIFCLTSVYVLSIVYYALSINDIDFGAIMASYIGLFFLSSVFVSIAVFASSISSNQVISFISGLLLCLFFYYGFELLSVLLPSGKFQWWMQNLGLHFHFQSLQRGVIDSRDIAWMLLVMGFFVSCTYFVLNKNKNNHLSFVSISILVGLLVFNYFFHFRMDLTAEKRYTLNPQSKKILENLDKPLEIQLYLTGDLNSGFTRLKQETLNLLDECSNIVPGKIQVHVTDPYENKDDKYLAWLSEKGITGVVVNERGKGGAVSQKIIFPWIMMTYGDKSKAVPLLIHQKNKSGEENLNLSIENIEYELITSINSLIRGNIKKIAFIEGHQELPETAVVDASDLLSRFYQVDRGALSDDINQLDGYQAVIISGPQVPFSEKDKFVLDQYLMKGGKICWLVNGAKIQPEILAKRGESPSMVNGINLDDMFFNYGVRINPVFLQDMQCLEILVNTWEEGTESVFEPQPFFYAPLLKPDVNHLITKNIMPVKSKFTSTIDFVGNDTAIKKTPLLSGFGYSHIIHVPEMISLHEEYDEKYFSDTNKQVVAALLEGKFHSLFVSRQAPEGIAAGKIITKSPSTKMIVIANEEIIANEISGYGKDTRIWPMGYDRYANIQFGNRDFIVNAVNYLTDDINVMSLRSKQFQLRLLDKQKIHSAGIYLVLCNLVFPSLFLILLFCILWFVRKRRYTSVF